MRGAVYAPLFVSFLLAAMAPQVSRQLSPALAARVLTAAAVITAAATTWALTLLAVTLINEVPPVTAAARAQGRQLPDPVPMVISLGALLSLVFIVRRLRRSVSAEVAARRTLRRLCDGHPDDTELVVAASPLPEAFAIPATRRARGRILVTTAMFAALPPAERRVLLAHERAHLTHRHARLCTATALATAANPLLTPVRDAVAFLVERWADEQAADAVGDRDTAARALARAALVAQRARRACALTFTDHTVTRRVAALQTTPPPYLWSMAAGVLALGALPAFCVAAATGDLLELLPRIVG